MQPAAMAPSAPARKATAVTKTKPTRELMPGDLVCAECGEGNAPTRKFCSRCGSSLEHAATARIPWWRRLLPKRKSKVMAAGQRPGVGADGKPKAPKKPLLSATRKIRKVLALLAFLFGIVYAAYAPLRENVNERVTSAKDKVMSIIRPQFEQVQPNGAPPTVTTETPENPGRNAVDTFKNTFWIAPPTDPQPALVLTFAEPVDLDRAIVRNGRPDDYTSMNRPEKLHFVYSTGESCDIVLKDTKEPQQIELCNGAGAKSVQVQVQSQFQSVPPNAMAFTEIEFFTQK